jgi:hypothetical protein
MSANPEPDDGPSIRVRSYVLTGGRTRSEVELPLETLVKVTPEGISAAPRLKLEHNKIIALCDTPISIALGVARVLVGDMCEEGFLTDYKPQHAVTGDDRPDLKLLERVLDGLQAL